MASVTVANCGLLGATIIVAHYERKFEVGSSTGGPAEKRATFDEPRTSSSMFLGLAMGVLPKPFGWRASRRR